MDDFRELYRRIEYLRNNGIKMKEIADCIADCIWHYDEKKDDISARVLALTRAFPLYQ